MTHSSGKPPVADPFRRLRSATPARIGLGRCGNGLPTRALLEFQLAHARARDAVHEPFDVARIVAGLGGREARVVSSCAPDRQTYLQRPDLGRQLATGDAALLARGDYDVAFVVTDGLSSPAIHAHALPLLHAIFARIGDWRVAPIIIARQGRVALGDEIGARLGTALVTVLIGERPGLSAPDSLGLYVTWGPRVGRQDSQRNCISNIRPPSGLSYDLAATRLAQLLGAAHRQRLTGVRLKDTATTASLEAPPGGERE